MHIPPYYKRESWQRFFAGVFIGGIVAFTIFIYMYGQFYERWVEENLNLRSQLSKLEDNYKVLEDSKKELDQKSKKDITVDTITIKIDNEKELKLENDSLMVHQLEEQIRKEINHVIGKGVNSLIDNYQLLESTIENKTFQVDEFAYNAKIKRLFVAQELQIHVSLQFTN